MLQGKFGRLESFAVSYSDWSGRMFEDRYLSTNNYEKHYLRKIFDLIVCSGKTRNILDEWKSAKVGPYTVEPNKGQVLTISQTFSFIYTIYKFLTAVALSTD